jgi:NADH-quinone oxidoreductase subunit N
MSGLAMAPELGALLSLLLFRGLTLAGPLSARALGRTARTAAALLLVLSLAAAGAQGTLFAGTLRIDLFSQLFKVMLALGMLLLTAVAPELPGVPPALRVEVHLLLWSATLALMLLVSAVHLLTLYVALELSSYALYLLTALREDYADAPPARCCSIS